MRYRKTGHRTIGLVGALACLLMLAFPSGASAQARLHGEVVDADTRAPVERANVLVRGDDRSRGTSTDSTGRFRVDLPPGTYTLEVSAVGYEGRRRTVQVEAGAATTVTVALASKDYSLNEIVVRDRRRESEATATTVQRVDQAAIETQDAADVSELAELVPATHVQTNSRGQTILYFRNAADRQVGQFFDGALLNIPWDNRVNISLIPASVIEDLVVTKGAPSIRYGANVLGGAINFQSRTLDAPGRRTEFHGAVGTAGERRASVTHLGRTDRWDYTAAVQYTARGDQPLPGGANLEFNQPLDDRRVNTDRKLLSGFGRASYRLENGGRLALSLLHVDAEQGVAPEGNKNPATGDVRYWRYPLWQKSTAILSGQAPLGSRTSLRGAAWGSRFARDIADYASIDYATLNQTQEGRNWTGGLRLIGTQDLPAGTLTLAFNGLTSRHEKQVVPAGEAPPEPASTYRQHIFSTGLEYEGRVHPRLQVTAGASFDGTATPETGGFPSRDPIYAWGLNTGLRADLAEGWALRGALGRKTRFPTMRELFSGALGKFMPNPGLQPVSAWIGEVGLERRAATWSLTLTPFYTRVQNTIGKTNVETPDGLKVKRINLDGARIVGVESALGWRPTEALRLDGSLTWSRPRTVTDDGGTQKLDEKPGLLGSGRVSYALPFGLSVMGQARYTGNVYARLDRVTGRAFGTLPEALILDARLAYDLSRLTGAVGGELYARGDNLTDEVQYIGLGLPRPGRSLRVGVRVAL
jgi:iron complex outermembrane receptor protein